jgi:tetratricopeptide (TPR) repeat protein
MNMLDYVLTQRRAMAVIFLAYVAFLHQIFNDSFVPGEPLQDSNGAELIDPMVSSPVLARASVLARSRLSGARRGPRMRRAGPGESTAEMPEEAEDEIAVLLRAMKHEQEATDEEDEEESADFDRAAAAFHMSIAEIHSSRGQYYEALGAFENAAQAAEAAADGRLTAVVRDASGRLEMRFHRYYAAESRFKDAVALGGSLTKASLVRVFSGLGWAALFQGVSLSRKDGETPETRFGWALQYAGPDVGLGPALAAPPLGACLPRYDGLDGGRAYALAGLCIACARGCNAGAGNAGGGVLGTDSSMSIRFCECASSILGGETRSKNRLGDKVAGAFSEPAARRALGLAWLSVGRGPAAHRQQQYALVEEQRRAARRSSCVLQLGRQFGKEAPAANGNAGASGTELLQCSHSALHLGLASYATSDGRLGLSYVDQFLRSVAASAASVAASEAAGKVKLVGPSSTEIEEEAAEGLIRFATPFVRERVRGGGAGVLSPVPAVEASARGFAVQLLARATPFLLRSGAAGASILKEARLARHIADLSKYVDELSAERLREVLESLLQAQAAAALESSSRAASDDDDGGSFGWPKCEVASLHRLIATLHYRIGDVAQAIGSLDLSLQLQNVKDMTAATPEMRMGTEPVSDCSGAEALSDYTNLAVMQMEAAGQSAPRWRAAIESFRQARRLAASLGRGRRRQQWKQGQAAAFSQYDPSLEVSYRHALRLAHRRGVYESCPGPLDALLYGASCRDL